MGSLGGFSSSSTRCEDDVGGGSHVASLQALQARGSRLLHAYLDRTTLYLKTRWLLFFLLLLLYVWRVWWLQGFFVVTYGLGIYLLNLLIGFISPQVDPETEELVLPVTNETGEYRPFQRQLLEFKCWTAGLKAVLLSLLMTCFSIFDLPVFWPILLVYFLLLFFLTMKQQIKRMIKYKYLPFSWGKQTYGDITRSKPTAASSAAPVCGGAGSAAAATTAAGGAAVAGGAAAAPQTAGGGVGCYVKQGQHYQQQRTGYYYHPRNGGGAAGAALPSSAVVAASAPAAAAAGPAAAAGKAAASSSAVAATSFTAADHFTTPYVLR